MKKLEISSRPVLNFISLLTLGLIILSAMLYSGISDGGVLMAITLIGVIIGDFLTRQIHPLLEAYFENIVICFLLYNCYFFYTKLEVLPLVGLVAIFVQRVTLFTFEFRKINFVWSIGLYALPIVSAFMVVIDISPTYALPLPSVIEMQLAGSGMILISTSISIQTVLWFRKTIKNIEKREKRVNSSYKQVLELNQILNHNLRTPLATALGQLEIAERKNTENKYIIQAKEALSQVSIQTSSVNNARKAFEGTANINEFMVKWKKIYKHDFVNFEFHKNYNLYDLTEEIAISLAVCFDIFAENSKEAGAKEMKIRMENVSQELKIEIIDDGIGAPEETIHMLGKPISSEKKHGAGIGTYLAQRLLLSAGGKIKFSNRKMNTGFKINIVI